MGDQRVDGDELVRAQHGGPPSQLRQHFPGDGRQVDSRGRQVG
ncbi:MAG: hypothetical protein V9E94_01735 [Microthrixaceae bacterium]